MTFQEQLCFSQSPEHEEFWRKVYSKFFPEMLWFKSCQSFNQGQRLGIDRVIQLSTGKTIYIDEKVTRGTPKSFFLECGPKGWIEKDLLIDFIAYAFIEHNKCYMLPWLLLKNSWKVNGETWKRVYSVKKIPNEGYVTLGVFVPIPVVLSSFLGVLYNEV